MYVSTLQYSKITRLLVSLLIIACAVLIDYSIFFPILFVMLLFSLINAVTMKPYDNIIVIRRISGSPHVLIKNRQAIEHCFAGDRLNPELLLAEIKNRLVRYFLKDCIRKKISADTHKIFFKSLRLEKYPFIKNIKEMESRIVSDKLFFVGWNDLLKKENVRKLSRKVPYYEFDINMGLLKEYVAARPFKINDIA